MGESKNNLATEGLSGQVGNLVFRRRKADGKVFVSHQRSASEGEPTDAQKAVHTKFQEAILYGKTAIADPNTKAQYEQKKSAGQSAFNVAVADYFNAPDIHEIDVSAYTGQIASTIRVRVTDDFTVKSVLVHIANADGSLVEEGNAVLQPNGVDWLYTATQTNESLVGDRITVKAFDIPHNAAVQEKTL
jgi:hypothetical protein